MDAVRSNGIVSNGKTSPSQQQPQNQTVPPLQRFLSHVSQLSKVIAPRCVRRETVVLCLCVYLDAREKRNMDNDVKAFSIVSRQSRLIFMFLLCNCSQDDDDVVDGFSVEFDALKAQSDAWKESCVIPAKAGALPFNIKRNR